MLMQLVKLGKLVCVVGFVGLTSAAGSFWQPRSPGRAVGDTEASRLRGGCSKTTSASNCGTGDACTGNMKGYHYHINTGTQTPGTLGCVTGTCVIPVKMNNNCGNG